MNRRSFLTTLTRAGKAGLVLALAAGAGMIPSIRTARDRFRLNGARQQVFTINPRIGVHTRLTDEVEERKIAQTVRMVREMGSPWMVEYFPWTYLEPRRGQYDWTHSEMVIEHAYAEGLNVIARLDSTPEWLRGKNTPFSALLPSQYELFATFVADFITHFKDRLKHYIIWNEPNVSFEWGQQKVDPASYVALLRQVYPLAKEADPNCVIMAAGLAPTLDQNDGALDDLVYLQRMYDAGAQPYFDALAIHAYGWKFAPDDTAAPDHINFARAALARQVMEKNGDGAKPAIITEGGWNDHPRWSKAVRPAQRIQYSIRAYQKAYEEWPWCQAVCLWNFRLPRPARSNLDYYTFVNPDFTPKPIYLAVQRYARGES